MLAALGLAAALTVVSSGTEAAINVSATTSAIGPGVQMNTGNAQCTANFVYRAGGHTYVGYAAHCASTGNDTSTNGCNTGSLPLGTKVSFVTGESAGSLGGLFGSSGGTVIGTGTLRYSSWLAMQAAHTTDSLTCAYNDLALVEVDPAYLNKVDPTVPYLGGPTAIAGLPGTGAAVYTVGSSSLRGNTRSTTGTVQASSLWSDIVKTSSAGVPGDSGSGYLDAKGRAVGVLSTLNVSMVPPSTANGIGSLAQEVAFARTHGVPGLVLVPGNRPFTPSAAGQSSGSGNLLGGNPVLGVLLP